MSSAIACAAVALSLSGAIANERLITLASGGQWVALARKESVLAPPDTCMVVNAQSGIVLRADHMSLEFRVLDPSWSLPTGARGAVRVAMPGFDRTMNVIDNTATMVIMFLTPEDMGQLIDAMDRAPAMTVTPGSAKPITVSLVGSTRATNAFRTCAGMKGGDAGPGTNPFR